MVKDNLIYEQNISILINNIKKKKELRHVNDNFVREYLLVYLQQNIKLRDFFFGKLNVKSAHYEKIVKEVRAKLRRMYGLFRVEEEVKKREGLFKEWTDTNAKRRGVILKEILGTHSSTKERLPFYQKLYQRIFTITGKPKSILDLACGINPFSCEYMYLNNVKYYAYDLNEGEIKLLNNYFNLKHKENKNFIGKAEAFDLLHWEKLAVLEQADVCFLFKIVDVLDAGKGHKISELVISNVPTKFVAVSFATKTMSGKEMNAPERKWMDWMCKRLGFSYKVLKFENEIFYVIKK
ncbi:hypothetical protein HYX11_05455 [Candidatus Woesearchaeota archaeon]|nr:hypothetical protein [Candidatus Woesearchaeota archaeon]